MPLPNRPLKRPGDPSDSPSGSKVKLPKLERDPEDFSSVVKTKLQSYTRTGQACDRCKVRKIRCDALPQGCSHCTNQNLECFVTDRVTGRTERRGYMIELEQEKTDMMNHIRALEKLLENKGVEVKPFHWSPFGGNNYPAGMVFDAMGNPIPSSHMSAEAAAGAARAGASGVRDQQQQQQPQWSQPQQGGGGGGSASWVRSHQTHPPSQLQQLTSYANSALLESRPGDNAYLGVGSDNAPLSAINGTKLSVLGTTIDITSFAAPDMDEPPANTPARTPVYNKSIQAFLQSVLNINPPIDGVELPPRSDAFEYSEWYFLMVFPFIPVLHKPSYMSLLTRIYDDTSFKPTTSELVVVHMVFATIYFQYGVRNHEDHEKQARLNELSNKHYHWCLNKFYEMILDSSLTSVQALILLGNHMRSFPKPGGAYLVVQFAHGKAIELGLHRAPRTTDAAAVTLETEMRSRAWWCVLTLGVTLNGRLGRPMPTILEEFDVPFPLAIPDECLTTEGITDRSRIGQCNYLVGLVGHKIVPLYMEMYSNLYSVRRDPARQPEVVARLEEQLRVWQSELPDELRVEKSRGSNTYMFALYAQSFALEFRLCLRHPSVCASADPAYQRENTRICEEVSREMLRHIGALLKLKSLDTTWYQLSVYVAAVFCTLVANWERRFTISQAEVDTLKNDMAQWLAITAEIGILLGSQAGFCTDLKRIVSSTIHRIEADMGQVKANGSPAAPQTQHLPSQASGSTTNGSTPSEGTVTGRNGSHTTNNNNYYDAAAAAYQQMAGYGDQGGVVTNGTTPGGTGPAPGGGPTSGYDPNDNVYNIYAATAAAAAVAAASGATPGVTAGAGAGDPDPQSNPLVAFASQATQQLAAASGHHHHHTQQTQQHHHQPHQPQQQPVSGGDEWRPGSVGGGAGGGSSSTWNDWTSAFIGSQDRYTANTLLNLGGGGGAQTQHPPPPSVSPPPHHHHHHHQQQQATSVDAAGLADIATAAAQQWPLLLFNDGTSATGGA